jgi:DNA-binding SARP family transcriptional activator
MTLDVGLLGPLEARLDGRLVDLGAPKQRAVLACLLLAGGRVVSTDRLVDVVWDDDPPPSALPSLQAYVSNLRRELRDDTGVSPIIRRAPGYVMDTAYLAVDTDLFRERLATATRAQEDEDWVAVLDATTDALGLWRGDALADLRPAAWVEAETRHLEDERIRAEELRTTAMLGAGRVADAVAHAGSLARRLPLRDEAARLHALALHQAGRTPEALEELREHAARLDRELGLEPSQLVRDLQTSLVRQEAWANHWPGAARSGRSPATPPRPRVAPDTPSGRRGFVGRTDEIARARSVIDVAWTGEPAWLVLTGPAGIGKTRLAERITTLVGRPGSEARVIRARCTEEAGAPAWWALRQLVSDLGADPADVLRAPPGTSSDSAKFEVYEHVRVLLEDAAATGPLVVLVDDVQWADESSLRALSYLAGSMTTGRILLVMTVRDNEGDDGVRRALADILRADHAHHVVVPPLSAEDVAALGALMTGEPVDPSEARLLAERTAGNALFVTEYARLSPDERSRGQVPLAVRGVLERRLGVLGDTELRVLQDAAIAGELLELDLLETVTGLGRDILLDVLESAVDEEIVVPRSDGTGYAFSHALLRDTVLAGVSPVRRQQAHLRLAAALATGSGGRLTRRAQHLMAARPLADPRELVDACRAAALLADDNWAAETAVHWWQGALDAFDQLPDDQQDQQERDDLLVAGLESRARAGQGSKVIEVVGEHLDDAVRRGRPATVGRLAAALLRAFGTWPWVVFTEDRANVELAHRLAALEDFVSQDPAALSRTLAAAAVGLCYEDDPRVFHELGARALARARDTGDPDVLSDALLGRMLSQVAVADRAADTDLHMRTLLDLPRARDGVDRAIAHSARVMSLCALGEVAAAEEQLRLGIEACDRYRAPVVRVQLRWSEVQLTEWRSGPGAARRLLETAVESHRRVDLYDGGYSRTAELGLRWSEGSLLTSPVEGDYLEPLVWDAVMAAEAGDVAAAEALVATRLSEPTSWVWATHGHLVVLAHTVADLALSTHAAALLDLVSRAPGTLALLGQAQILGPTDLARARLHDLLGDDAAARELARSARDLCLGNVNKRWARHCDLLSSPHTAAVRAALAAPK